MFNDGSNFQPTEVTKDRNDVMTQSFSYLTRSESDSSNRLIHSKVAECATADAETSPKSTIKWNRTLTIKYAFCFWIANLFDHEVGS